MKNLPHQKPIRFVEDIVKKDADYIFVSCSFPYSPTLSMICEAAAQSSIVFSQNEKPQIGFLLSLKDVELLKDCDILEFQIKIKKDTSFDLLNEFSFELINQNDIYAKGTFIVKLQD
mgnify:FL=1